MKKESQTRGHYSIAPIGHKPTVAFENEGRAKQNIEDKLKLIVQRLKNVSSELFGSEPARMFPTSVRQFNLWAPELSAGLSLHKNSNETLNKHPTLRSSVVAAVEAVAARQISEKKNSSKKEERLAAARRSSSLNITIRIIAEKALGSARRELNDAREEVETMSAQLQSLEVEARRIELELKKEIDLLRGENARLVKALAKVVSIRKA